MGCSKTATITIYVISIKCPDESVYVPNTFTPNADGNNDILFVRGVNISELYFAVYNRWGEMVFESTDINNVWDGTYRGKKLENGIFVYYLKIKLLSESEGINQSGNISLVN
jgi:gliding motility-associated-like protein